MAPVRSAAIPRTGARTSPVVQCCRVLAHCDDGRALPIARRAYFSQEREAMPFDLEAGDARGALKRSAAAGVPRCSWRGRARPPAPCRCRYVELHGAISEEPDPEQRHDHRRHERAHLALLQRPLRCTCHCDARANRRVTRSPQGEEHVRETRRPRCVPGTSRVVIASQEARR